MKKHAPPRARTARRLALPALLLGTFTTVPLGCATVAEPEVVHATSQGGEPAVSATLANQGGRSLKRKLVIARFNNETLYGKSALLAGKEDLIARQAADILATRLTESGRFLLFERADADELLAAQSAGQLASMGLPADFLILGSVSEFGRETLGESGLLSRTKKQKAYARVNVRLVDVRTSRVIYATEGAGEALSETGTVMGIGTRSGYDSTLNDKAISAAISKLVGKLYENLLDQPWKAYLLDVSEDRITISGGSSQGLELGDRLALWKRGKTVQNPQSGMPIELPGIRVGTLEVLELHGNTPETELAICRLAEGAPPAAELAAYIVLEEES